MEKMFHLAGDHIIQLNLNDGREPGDASLAAQIAWLIDQLLEVIAENIADEDTDRSNFRTRLPSAVQPRYSDGGQSALHHRHARNPFLTPQF
jgi:hypothetical protein